MSDETITPPPLSTDAETLAGAVDAVIARQTDWLARANRDTAEAAVEAHMDAQRARQEAAGLIVSESTYARVEAEYRRQFDEQLRAEGRDLAVDLDLVAVRVRGHVEASEPLPSLSAGLNRASSTSVQLAVLSELQHQRGRQTFAGKTRAQLVDAYGRLDDLEDNALIRMVEDAVISGAWQPLGLRDDDPEADALSIPKLQAAVRARREARVEPAVREAAQKLAAIQASPTFRTLVEHLQRGKGIAAQPKQVMVAVR